MAYTKYSLTPANNTAAPPDGAPEGMLPSAVNDTMRDMMAQIRDVGDGVRDGTYTMTAVKITGGTINGATIGATTATTGAFTTLSATGVATFSAGTVSLPAITTTGDTNTGIFFPAADTIAFTEGGTESMRIDSSGNLGLGVTPSAWGSGSKGFQVLKGGLWHDNSQYFALVNNAYYDGTNWKYISTAASSQIVQILGESRFYNAASGSAGNNVTYTQAMTLDSSGNLLVGKTSASVGANGFEALADGTVSSTLSASTSATSTYNAYSSGVGAFRFYVDMGGTVHATSIVITAISDQRLKENVRDIDTGLDAIMALKPRRFDWKEGKGQDKKDVAGFIAQEFEDVFPECVSTSKAGADGIEYKNINHETLIPTLVKAIQELKAEFDAYKATHP